jgi:hypothetical protein
MPQSAVRKFFSLPTKGPLARIARGWAWAWGFSGSLGIGWFTFVVVLALLAVHIPGYPALAIAGVLGASAGYGCWWLVRRFMTYWAGAR